MKSKVSYFLLIIIALVYSCGNFEEKKSDNWLDPVFLGDPAVEFWIIKRVENEDGFIFKVNGIGVEGGNLATKYDIFLSQYYDRFTPLGNKESKILVEVDSVNSVSIDTLIEITQKHFFIENVEYKSIQNWIVLSVKELAK